MNSERRYEHIENKIKEASENIPYAFDESAWDKMEAKLDEKDRRRPIFWLWFLLPIFLVAGWYMFTSKSEQKNEIKLVSEIKSNEKTNTISPSSDVVNTTSFTKKQSNVPVSQTTQLLQQSNKIRQNAQQKTNRLTYRNKAAKNSISPIAETNFSNKTKKGKSVIDIDAFAEKLQNKENISIADKGKTSSTIGNATADIDATAKVIADEKAILNKVLQNNTTNKETNLKKDTIIQQEDKSVVKKSKKVISRFYVAANIGGAISSVKLMSFSNSPIVAKYGLSLGYEFNKKIAVQAGVFMGNKKYIAGTNDYNVKQGSYLSMVTITSIDANCAVYEIPLSIKYNFLQRHSFNYYAAVGISSFIMKKEDYNYHYKRYNAILEYPYSYTGNHHLFSNMQFSVGIEKRINNRLALQIEPSISVPLSGVGEGKVRLYESNLQFGIKYHPFK